MRNYSIESKPKIACQLFVVVFLLNFSYGIYLGLNGILLGDAVSRTANAYYVLNVKPYRFASMGLVWNPLPSTLQLPFIALAKLWKPLVTNGIGAAFVTSAFNGWNAVILFQTYREMKVNQTRSISLSALSLLNPYVFFYGANGMSEMISFSFTILIICKLTLWMRFGISSELVTIAIGFVGLFLTRYESIPFAAAVGLSVVIFILSSQREKKYFISAKKSEVWFYLEGTMVLLFSPIVYAAFAWIMYNWMITGNPLYFLNSGYSLLAVSAYFTSNGGFLEILGFLWSRTWPFIVLTIAIVISRTIKGKLLHVDTMVFLICSLALTVFQFIMLLRGGSAGYVRYMSYPLLVSVAWLPYELSHIDHRSSSCKNKIAYYIILFVIIFMFLWFGAALSKNEIFREDTLLMLPEGSEQMADYINSRLSNQRILMDAYRAYYVFMLLDNPDNIVISSSENFYESIADPAAYSIDYIMVPESGSYGDMDAVNIAYRSLYSYGAEWCTEEISIGEFKLFHVIDRVWEIE